MCILLLLTSPGHRKHYYSDFTEAKGVPEGLVTWLQWQLESQALGRPLGRGKVRGPGRQAGSKKLKEDK